MNLQDICFGEFGVLHEFESEPCLSDAGLPRNEHSLTPRFFLCAIPALNDTVYRVRSPDELRCPATASIVSSSYTHARLGYFVDWNNPSYAFESLRSE
jgi:hypothetical protein